MQKRKYLVVLVLLFLFAPMVGAQYVRAQHVTKAEEIKFFYDRYMECIETGNHKMGSDLLRSFLTPEMQEKRGRLIDATGADPILRAQDVSEHGRQTLTCRHLEGNWFEVAYRSFSWGAQDVSEHGRQTLTCRHLEGNWFEVAYRSFSWGVQDTVTIRIPMRTEEDEKGRVRINYIVPEWGGSRYGDYLFDIQSQRVIDRLDARIFVETFFKAYVYPYATMSPSLEQDLEQLRKRYCTQSFLRGKYAAIKQEYLEDGESIDPLINCADFDAFWHPSIRVDFSDSLTFRIGYDTDGTKGWHKDIKVMVRRENGKLLLSDIDVE